MKLALGSIFKRIGENLVKFGEYIQNLGDNIAKARRNDPIDQDKL